MTSNSQIDRRILNGEQPFRVPAPTLEQRRADAVAAVKAA